VGENTSPTGLVYFWDRVATIYRKSHGASSHWICGASVILTTLLCPSIRAETVSFRNDVMAVLSKAGCNLGTCHGNQNGKAGFKLSLRGEDAEWDHRALTRDMFGRRTNPNDPDQSLVLLKATAQLAHEGGQRFKNDSREYAMLREWIMGGMKDDGQVAPTPSRLIVTPAEKILIEPSKEVQFRVEAEFTDGSRRNVTSLACYEPSAQSVKVTPDGLAQSTRAGEATVIVRYLNQQVPVRLAFVPNRPAFAWSNPRAENFIDEHIFAKLKSLRINPSEVCSDTEFVRRAYLDLPGILPTADEARSFAKDRDGRKRARFIDELLQRPEFADFWALKWADLLRNEEKVLDTKGVQAFYRWIRQSVAENKPVDQFVRELLTARGSTYENPAANYFRALRDPVTRAESTAQLFLGTRLQCARCHNHPFDRWTQADYYDWADVFAPVAYKIIDNRRRDGLDTHEFNGEQIVWRSDKSEVKNPRTGKPARARLLGSVTPMESEEGELERLANWLTSPGNKLFARAQVNRIWYHLIGRGIVDPIDDFRPTNPPSIPSLLDALADEFAQHKYDLRHIVRVIMNSRAYQTSVMPNESNVSDESNFSHTLVRRLTAEQLLDAQNEVTGVPSRFNGYPAGVHAAQIPGVRAARGRERKLSDADVFLKVFGKPERVLTCECERSMETTMGQAFQLISGPGINELLTESDNRLGKLLKSGKPPEAMVNELYWTALSRAPTVAESEQCAKRLTAAKDQRRALEDLTWALLNAKEFVLRR
jgi:hypothetical protein